jgi:hypothetical protein
VALRRDDRPLDGLHLKKPSYQILDGLPMPMGFPPRGLASARKYVPADGDVVVTTYPKCGTTWVQYMVWLLINRGAGFPEGEGLREHFPHLEEVGRRYVGALPEPRLIKTHLPREMLQLNPRAKYIYVARNPFDCAVSFYHHTRGFVRHYDFADGTFAEFFECFIAGEVDFGDYFDNLLSWYESRPTPSLLSLTYEDIKADPIGALGGIGRFLGGVAAESAADPALVERIVADSSFERMSIDQLRWASERPAGMPKFVRKGIVGDWRSHFDSSQARRLAEKFDRRTRNSDAAGLWPDILAAARAH